MDEKYIVTLAERFRNGIEKARDAGCFENDIIFSNFPRGCCGDTSYLLGEYFRFKGIETIYEWGDYQGQTHAWLVVKDSRVKTPKHRCLEMPDEIKEILNRYSNGASCKPVSTTYYEIADLEMGVIVDITADQFGEPPVYVGLENNFYRQFDFGNAEDYHRLGTERLYELYQTIIMYM